ncbi:MAG: Vitamin B12 dependent methionine synthase activation subunit [Firmicutes bacterium]|nr:Vitamin B12 dependent methionine synthase activation subunit [Bacillota bacterium]
MRTDVIRRETLRYLGLGSAEPDSKTLELVNKAIELLSERCRPRSTSRIVEISAGTEEIRLEGGTVIHSESLARVMAGCSRMLVFGATLGTEADILIRRETAVNIAMGVVMQAAAAAYIEEYCDDIQTELDKRFSAEGEPLGDRFSPGYGDFALEYQRELFAILDCPRQIGLTLTEDFIMIPSKSVTAVIPIGGSCGRQLGCRYCEKTDCRYRRID